MPQHTGSERGGRQAVFVYGTLKRECSNHYFLQDAPFLGQARTVERYGLYVAEYPLVYPGDAVCRIRGEVYAVDGETLKRLDILEDHPHLYRRQETEVLLDSGKRLRAWIYFYPERAGRLISDGEFNPTARPDPE